MLKKNTTITAGELKKFGITISIALAVIAWILLLKGHSSGFFFSFSALLLLLVSLIQATLLRRIYPWWMKLAEIMGFVMTRLILTVLFYTVFTPMGLVARLIGKDFLSIKMPDQSNGYGNNSPDSYWVQKEVTKLDSSRMEKQY
ncbi:MAG: SxtJ family membrane protein [Thermodesulfobacteriota bacterium]|nr:SxtJ family membrane protein [Thermodesulfobacteriota bacterium]